MSKSASQPTLLVQRHLPICVVYIRAIMRYIIRILIGGLVRTVPLRTASSVIPPTLRNYKVYRTQVLVFLKSLSVKFNHYFSARIVLITCS